MDMTDQERKKLRRCGHSLKPIVMIGQSGLTNAVTDETDQALTQHELIKIRVRVGDRIARDRIIDELTQRCCAQLIQRIGHVALLYRKNPDD